MRKFVAGALLMMFAATANAAIIYDVNRTIGAGNVTGFIETDGTLGVLEDGDITAFMLTLTAPNLRDGSPLVLDGFTILIGNSLTATSTQLLFDFSLDGLLVFLDGFADNFWCLETASGGCGGGVGEHIGRGTDDFIAQSASQSGNVVIASVASVPEPSTLMLMGIGLVGLGWMGRRRRKSL